MTGVDVRKLILGLIILLVCISCTDKEDVVEKEQEERVVFYTYERYQSKGYPYSETYDGNMCWKTSGRFYIFQASEITTDIKKDALHLGDDWWQDDRIPEVISILKNEGKLLLADGKMVQPLQINTIHYKYGEFIEDYVDLIMNLNGDNWSDLNRNVVELPFGEYFIVAIDDEVYSGKYINIYSNMIIDDEKISIVFPSDEYYRGYFDWITPQW